MKNDDRDLRYQVDRGLAKKVEVPPNKRKKCYPSLWSECVSTKLGARTFAYAAES